MTAHWIDDARQFYVAKPWVSVALGLQVHIASPLITVREAAVAIVEAHGPKSLELIAQRAAGFPCGPNLLAFAATELRRSNRLSAKDIKAAIAVAKRGG